MQKTCEFCWQCVISWSHVRNWRSAKEEIPIQSILVSTKLKEFSNSYCYKLVWFTLLLYMVNGYCGAIFLAVSTWLYSLHSLCYVDPLVGWSVCRSVDWFVCWLAVNTFILSTFSGRLASLLLSMSAQLNLPKIRPCQNHPPSYWPPGEN